MRDEFFRGRTWPNFESFKVDLDAYVTYWNTQRRQAVSYTHLDVYKRQGMKKQ